MLHESAKAAGDRRIESDGAGGVGEDQKGLVVGAELAVLNGVGAGASDGHRTLSEGHVAAVEVEGASVSGIDEEGIDGVGRVGVEQERSP